MISFKIFGGVRNSAVASQPCPWGHTTEDKILNFVPFKLPSVTSFIPGTLCEIEAGLNWQAVK